MLFLIIFVLSFAGSYFLPWWMVAIIAFLAAFWLGKTSGQSFWSGFGAVFAVWTILALMKTIPNENILADKVVQLFPIPHSWILLLLITAIIGGLVGGMSAWSGVLLKRALAKK
jgi:hypothetical protein